MKVYVIKKEVILLVLCAAVITIGMLRIYANNAISVFLPTTKKVIIIDAGHGGFDPGMVSSRGTLEKDLNLEIAEILQSYLEQSGAHVIITRNEDTALANKKRDDMRERKNIANNSKADILISIHQNSFPDSIVKGAQVFYHNSSENGKLLAECVQDEIKSNVDSSNNRVPKANTDYYILKTTEIPAVIVECGFITNQGEEQKLKDKDYQEKIAWAIYRGTLSYFKQLDLAIEE